MSALSPDYDTDPGRSRAWSFGGDVHGPVARRLVDEQLAPVLDIGCGRGQLAAHLPAGWSWIGVDPSSTQLRDCPARPVTLATATSLPVRPDRVAAVAALWMLYHLDDPTAALREVQRVLRPGGAFVACTSARTNDPELVPEGYPPTTFDAEEAPAIVASVFGDVEVERWDAPLVHLADRDEVRGYARQHLLPPEVADRVTPPLTLTKRGCLVWAYKR